MRFLILMVALVAGCASAPQTGLTVSAAASLQGAFQEIAALPGSPVIRFNFGSSGALQKQIEESAPVDVFASAGVAQMDALDQKGLLLTGTRQDFALNQLVLVVPVPATVPIEAFADLAAAQVTRIAIGNPKTVPAGQYAQETLTRLNLWTKVEGRLVPAGDVRQVVDYVSHAEVDAGLVYASDVHGLDSVRVVATAPADSHAPIVYPIAVIKDSQQAEAARQFVQTVAGPQGQSILQKYGFASPQP